MVIRTLRPRSPLLAAAAALGLALPALASEGLTPPLEGPRSLTSSFGEYRSGHYHAGLDLSTGGREGEPVRAPAAGEVARLRASGTGYGKAVYFRLEDGRTAVYAHLSRFEPRIAAMVEAEQDRLRRYEVDFAPPRGSLRFSAGELLAFTGSSGAGPAHLHAELRMGEDGSIALNPLLGAWALRDTVPPALTRARVEPVSAGARVRGGVGAVTIPLERGRVPGVEVTGPVRIWLEVSDRADGGGNRLAPYRLRWSVDGVDIAEIAFDRVDWNAPQEVRWTFREDLARLRNERWLCLEPPPAARQRLARWLDAGPDWFTGLAPGEHRVCCEAEDAAGNRVVREFALTLTGSPAAKDSLGAAEDAPSPGAAVQLRGAEDPLAAPVLAEPSKGCRLSFPAGASYGGLEVTVTEADSLARASRGEPELEPVTPLFQLEPWAHPLREEARVELLLPPSASRRGVALYRRDRGPAGESWSFVGADTSGEGVAGMIGALEDLALLRDRIAPEITLEPPGEGRRRLVARVADGGSGVTWRGLEMTLDGEPVLAEWDPEAARFTAHLRADPGPGRHLWAVQAADRVGNRAERSLTFTAR